MDLAALLTKAATAETLVRVVAEIADADWNENLAIYGDPAATDHDRTVAYGKLLAIAPYRALFTSAVDIWDREPVTVGTVVHIGTTP